MPLRGRASISSLVTKIRSLCRGSILLGGLRRSFVTGGLLESGVQIARITHGIVAVSGLQRHQWDQLEEAKHEQNDVGRRVRRGRVYRRNPGGADERNAEQSKFKRNHHTDGVSPKG